MASSFPRHFLITVENEAERRALLDVLSEWQCACEPATVEEIIAELRAAIIEERPILMGGRV